MNSKILYVSEIQAHIGQHAVIDIVSPKVLDDLLGQGWFITKSEKRKVNHPTSGKRVTVDRIELSNERGVAAQGPTAERVQPSGDVSLVSQGFSMLAKAIQGREGPPGSTESGYLGRSIAGQIPGVSLVTSLAPGGAFGMGADAAKSGKKEDSCPFPEGSVPFSEWLKGFINGGGRPDPETLVGIEEGRLAANGPKDAEVNTRFAVNTRGYVGFLVGFTNAGGRLWGNGNV